MHQVRRRRWRSGASSASSSGPSAHQPMVSPWSAHQAIRSSGHQAIRPCHGSRSSVHRRVSPEPLPVRVRKFEENNPQSFRSVASFTIFSHLGCRLRPVLVTCPALSASADNPTASLLRPPGFRCARARQRVSSRRQRTTSA